MAIQIQELPGSPQEKYSLDSFSATRTFIVPWEQRDAFARYFLGDRLYACESLTPSDEEDESLVPPSSEAPIFGPTSRLAYPGKPGVYVSQIAFEPFEPNSLDVSKIARPASTLGEYGSFAKATVSYRAETTSVDRSNSPSVDSGTCLTYKMVACGESIPLSTRGWRWRFDATAPVPDDLQLVKRVPTIEHQLVWSNVVNPPWEKISATQGTVNANPFLGYAAGTLLFEGAEANKIFNGEIDAGAVAYTWQIRFLFREKRIEAGGTYGWNDFYRESTGTWEPLVDAAGSPLYRSADHASLFVQSQTVSE